MPPEAAGYRLRSYGFQKPFYKSSVLRPFFNDRSPVFKTIWKYIRTVTCNQVRNTPYKTGTYEVTGCPPQPVTSMPPPVTCNQFTDATRNQPVTKNPVLRALYHLQKSPTRCYTGGTSSKATGEPSIPAPEAKGASDIRRHYEHDCCGCFNGGAWGGTLRRTKPGEFTIFAKYYMNI